MMYTATIRADEPTRVQRRSSVVTPIHWDPAFEETLRHTTFRGICYATAERAKRLYEGGSSITDHLTIVEHIGLATRLATETRYDFILMAGSERSQFDDILTIAGGINAAGRKIPPVNIHGAISGDTKELLPLFASKYDLKAIYRANTGERIDLV